MTMNKTQKIDLLRGDIHNARVISEEALAGLGAAVDEFGDLSGIVFNMGTGNLVAGHQRVKVLRDAGVTHWTQTSETTGYIEHPTTKERFGVRIVDWGAERERLANLTANNPAIAGEFSPEASLQLQVLAQNEELQGMMAGLRLDTLLDDLGGGEPDVPKGPRKLDEFDVTPKARPAWILIAATEDIAAELEAELRGRFENNPNVRVELSSGKDD